MRQYAKKVSLLIALIAFSGLSLATTEHYIISNHNLEDSHYQNQNCQDKKHSSKLNTCMRLCCLRILNESQNEFTLLVRVSKTLPFEYFENIKNHLSFLIFKPPIA